MTEQKENLEIEPVDFIEEGGIDPRPLYEHYDPLQNIQQHDLCETFLMRRRGDRKVCIAKVYNAEAGFSPEKADRYLKDVSHPKLAEYIESMQLGAASCLLRAYVPGDSLEYMVRSRRFNEEYAYLVVCDVVEVLDHLHRLTPPVYHRAIKLTNVVIDDDVVFVMDVDAYKAQLVDTSDQAGAIKDIRDVGFLIRDLQQRNWLKGKDKPGTLRALGEQCIRSGKVPGEGFSTIGEVRQALTDIKDGVRRRKHLSYLLLAGIFVAWIALTAVLLNIFLPELI
ncbi:MAG TPA: hypothetical protein GX726_01745 [Clostridiales bacterium]|jgi:serine/threonine protein kinase|nr:hypothetical protein [Clostridiales bacterium]